MDICAADGGFVNLDQDIAGTWLGNRNLLQFQTGSGIWLDNASMYCCMLLLLCNSRSGHYHGNGHPYEGT